MGNVIGHGVEITGPAAELKRFAACWVMPAKGERFPPYVERKFKLNDGVTRPEDQLFFSFDKLSPKPDDADKWVLQRWGVRYVAYDAEIEMKDEAITLRFASKGYGAHYAIFDELAELFPTLVMEGYVDEPMNCYGGDVHIADGKYTFTDKSAEIEAAYQAWAKKQPEQFYAEVVKYARGEPADITKGTVGEIKAKIGKRLIDEEPGLADPARRSELKIKVDAIYDRDHAVKITLTEEDLALVEEHVAAVRMMATREDDLPQA